MKIRIKGLIGLMTALSLLASLSGCQSASKTGEISRKDDADLNVSSSAEATYLTEASNPLQYSDTFTSQDGTVTFHVGVDDSFEMPDLPEVEVVPHYLTEEDAKNAAIALCGPSADFYEAEPVLNERYTKSDVIAQIDRWSPYTSVDKLKELFPNGNEETWKSDAQTLQEAIAYLTNEYMNDSAPDYVHTPCQWTFYKDSHYMYGKDAAGMDTSEENDQISVYAANENGTYQMLTIARRNKSDFKLNNISYIATTSGPLDIDYALYRAEKLRTDKPTEDQILQATQKAQMIMDQMNLGKWKIVSPHIGEYQAGNYTEYIIHMTAVPVFEDIAVIDCPQLSNLKADTEWASNYYLTKATFDFTPDGSLMKFNLYSPVDVVQVQNGKANVLPADKLFSSAKDQLMSSNIYSFGADPSRTGNGDYCNVYITDVQYGLGRMKVPNTEDSYQYGPTVMYSGSVELFSPNSAEPYYKVEDTSLLQLNAVDGSVIPLQNE